ncbi:MAG: FixH family protein [Rhodomicrobium sp.]|jgi:nitrogen fixation protein FixH
MSGAATQTQLTGKHVLVILLAALAVVGSVNATFIYFALSTGPGEERGASYETGLRYNGILSEEKSQEALQWRHRAQIDKGSRLRVAIAGKDGAPIAGLAVAGTFSRPASSSGDVSLAFKEIDAGVYEAELGTIDPGSWVLAFTAEKGRPRAETTYRVKERLWLSPAH